jgi:hypothetical protein
MRPVEMEPAGTQENILLTVIVVLVSDTVERKPDLNHLDGCLAALRGQVDPPSMEVIVPYQSTLAEFESIKPRYPEVVFIPVPDLQGYNPQGKGREHHDELRGRGIAASHGEIIALLEDHARPDPNWSRQTVTALCERYPAHAAVGGAIENDIDHAINWAVYFCDFGKYQNPVAAGDTSFASDANIAYRRAPLFVIRPVWEKAFHETEVNARLMERGEKIALHPEMIVYQHRNDLNLGEALAERYVWGKSYAVTRGRMAGPGKRLVYALLSPLIPVVIFTRIASNARRKQARWREFLRVSPLVLLLTLSWSLGEVVGYLTA